MIKKFITTITGLLFLFVLGIGSLGYWLSYTDSGRDFTLAQVRNLLPADSTVHWTHVQGQLGGVLRFQHLQFRNPSLQLDADTLEVQLTLTDLLLRRIGLERLYVKNLQLHLPEDNTPFEFPHWPNDLPKLDLPIRIHAQAVRIEQFQIYRENKLIYSLDALTASLYLQPGALHIDALKAQSTQAIWHLEGFYQANNDYATRLTGGVSIQTPGQKQALQLQVNAQGNAKAFQLHINGAMPKPTTVQWLLTSENAQPVWHLQGASEGLMLSYLGVVDEAVYRFELNANGDNAKANLHGMLARDDQSVIIKPSQLQFHDNTIRIDSLNLLYAGGLLNIEGQLDTNKPLSSPGLRVRLQNVPIPVANSQTKPVLISGTAQWSGRIEQWQMRAQGVLQRDHDTAQFAFSGNGGNSAVNLPSIRIKTPQGGLQGQTKIVWSPRLAVNFEGQLQEFDPSYFFSNFPGRINARVVTQVSQTKQSLWQGQVKIAQLAGELRQRVLAGHADVRFVGLNISGQADMHIGQSHIMVQGGQQKSLNLKAQFSPLNLNDVHPDWRGLINATVAVQGARSQPAYTIQMHAQQLRIQNLELDSLQVVGDTIQAMKTQLKMEGLRVGGQLIGTLDVQALGALNNAQLSASLQAPNFSASTQGPFHLQWQETSIKFLANYLHINGERISTWTLQAPTEVRWSNAALAVADFCLLHQGDFGQLCVQNAAQNYRILGNDLSLSLLEPWLNNEKHEFVYRGLGHLEAEIPKDFDLRRNGRVQLSIPTLHLAVKPVVHNEVGRVEDISIDAHWLANQLSIRVAAQLEKNGFIRGALDTGFSEHAPLVGDVEVQMYNLDWLELLSLDIAQPKGSLTGKLSLAGTRDNPLINGAYALHDLNFDVPALGLRIKDGQISAQSRDNMALLVKGSIASGGGHMAITGLWDVAGQLDQPLNLRLIAKNFALADTPDMQAMVNADVILSSENNIYALDGSIDVVKAFVNLERIDAGVSISNDVVVLDPAVEKKPTEPLKLNVRLKLKTNDQVRVKGYGLVATVHGGLDVNSPYNAPVRVNGSLQLSGKYKAYGQDLDIERGNLTYTNASFSDPRLDIYTERTIGDISVGLEVSGMASNPTTRLVSNPPMPDSEALSWLVFGRPLNAVNANQAQSINASSLALSASSNIFLQKLGGQIGLDQAAIIDSRALGGSTLTVGKQILPRLYVSYGVSLLGIGQVITLKYLLYKGLDMTLETEQTETNQETSAALNWRK